MPRSVSMKAPQGAVAGEDHSRVQWGADPPPKVRGGEGGGVEERWWWVVTTAAHLRSDSHLITHVCSHLSSGLVTARNGCNRPTQCDVLMY